MSDPNREHNTPLMSSQVAFKTSLHVNLSQSHYERQRKTFFLNYYYYYYYYYCVITLPSRDAHAAHVYCLHYSCYGSI